MMTRRKKKRIKAAQNSTRGLPGYSIGSYCPYCYRESRDASGAIRASYEDVPRVKVGAKQRTANSKCGHSWELVRAR